MSRARVLQTSLTTTPASLAPMETASDRSRRLEQLSAAVEGIRAGDRDAEGRLFELIYSDLHARARGLLARHARHHTLQPTALVNELYMRIGGQSSWVDAGHMLHTAFLAMGHILADYERARLAERRGGGRAPEPLQPSAIAGPDGADAIALLDLYDALALVKRRSSFADHVRIVELRYFGGLDFREIAEVVGLKEDACRRRWTFALGWIAREMQRGEGARDES